MPSIQGISIAPRAQQWLGRSNQARILNLFSNAVNLINEAGDVFSIVVPELGNGPFALVVDSERIPDQIKLTDQIVIGPQDLQIGETVFSFASAQTWNPVPDWGAFSELDLAELIQMIENQLNMLNASEGMAGVFYPAAQNFSKFRSKLLTGSLRLLDGLRTSNVDAIMTGADTLGGLGFGLTPSGDDFLMGVMYGLHATRAEADAVTTAELIWAGAAGKTTALSREWLAAAVAGEAVESWHKFIKTASSNRGHEVEKAVQAILSIGETSGADALTGFVKVLKLENRR